MNDRPNTPAQPTPIPPDDRATEEGRFEGQIVRVPVCGEDGWVSEMTRDEGIRKNSDPEKVASLEPVFDPEGVVTAGNSSQISAAAAALLMSDRSVLPLEGYG